CRIARKSPVPPRWRASASAASRASFRWARRAISWGATWSRQSACAVPVSANSAKAAKTELRGTRFVMAILRGRPALQIRGRRHADHVEASVHEVHFAGDAARETTKQLECRAADMVKLDR